MRPLHGWPLALALLFASASAQQASPYAARFAALCAACHGAAGKSELPLTPSLGGQPSFYAVSQLFLFRDGAATRRRARWSRA